MEQQVFKWISPLLYRRGRLVLMESIYIVTGNQSKLAEFKAILEPLGFRVKSHSVEVEEPKTLDQEKVAISTAIQAYKVVNQPVITDDTGIFFRNYTNFPGTYTKFLFQAIGFEGIRRLMRVKNKDAYFQTTLCLYDGKETKTFQGWLEGKVTLKQSKKFNQDWSYDSIFIPKGSKKYFSEYTLEERKRISHRAKAIKKLIKFLKENHD